MDVSFLTYLSIRSHRWPYIGTASSVSFQAGSQLNHCGNSSSGFEASGRYFKIFVMAEIAFSVGLRFFAVRDSGAVITFINSGTDSETESYYIENVLCLFFH